MIQLHQGIEKSQKGLTVENQSPCVTLHLRVNHFLAILPPQAILVLLEGHQTPVPKRPILIIKAHLRPLKIHAPFWKDTTPPSSVVMIMHLSQRNNSPAPTTSKAKKSASTATRLWYKSSTNDLTLRPSLKWSEGAWQVISGSCPDVPARVPMFRTPKNQV